MDRSHIKSKYCNSGANEAFIDLISNIFCFRTTIWQQMVMTAQIQELAMKSLCKP